MAAPSAQRGRDHRCGRPGRAGRGMRRLAAKSRRPAHLDRDADRQLLLGGVGAAERSERLGQDTWVMSPTATSEMTHPGKILERL
jgi:hypothetical protein